MDFRRLLDAYLVDLATRVIRESMQEPVHPLDLHEFATNHQWKTEFEDLSQWTDRVEQPPEVARRMSYLEYATASGLGEDLLSGTGVRGQWLGDMQETKTECVGEFELHLKRIARGMARHLGTASALAWLELLRDQLVLDREHLETSDERWSLAWQDEVKEAIGECRANARPARWWRRLAGACLPSLPASWILGEYQTSKITVEMERLDAALLVRHRDDLLQMKLEILDELTGRGDRPGVIRHLAQELRREHEASIEKLTAAISGLLPHMPLLAVDCSIFFVEELRSVLNRSGLTLLDLYDDAFRRSACSAPELAKELQQGLTIQGQLRTPGEWLDVPPLELAAALMSWLRHRIGMDAKRVNIQSPRTALDLVAAITPAHPALRERAEHVIHLIKQRSAPYYEVEPPLAGVEPHTVRYLYCYGPHRRFWLELLGFSTKTHLDPQQGSAPSEFNLNSPYRVVLAQFAFNLPGQAHPMFLRGSFRARRLQRFGFPLLFDTIDWREHRQITRRPTSPTACREMFDCLLECGEIYPMTKGSDRFLPSRTDPSYDGYFRDKIVVAAEQPAEFWARAVRSGAVRRWISQVVQPDADLRQLFAELAVEPDPRSVAGTLVQEGILHPLAGQLYALNGTIPAPRIHAPADLYEERTGKLAGIGREEFIAHLLGSEGFFNLFYFRLFDAVAEGRLNRARAPKFLQRDLVALGIDK